MDCTTQVCRKEPETIGGGGRKGDDEAISISKLFRVFDVDQYLTVLVSRKES